jgi:hypothetical protein
VQRLISSTGAAWASMPLTSWLPYSGTAASSIADYGAKRDRSHAPGSAGVVERRSVSPCRSAWCMVALSHSNGAFTTAVHGALWNSPDMVRGLCFEHVRGRSRRGAFCGVRQSRAH